MPVAIVFENWVDPPDHISLAVIQPKSLPLSVLALWQALSGSLSRIAHDETNYSAVYFKTRLTETYEIWIEQGY